MIAIMFVDYVMFYNYRETLLGLCSCCWQACLWSAVSMQSSSSKMMPSILTC